MGTRHPLTLRQQLARQIRLQRLYRGWSQDTLAALSGLHRSYIGGVERAERNITIDNIEKIAAALDVPAAQLLGQDGLPVHGPAQRDARLRETRAPYCIPHLAAATKSCARGRRLSLPNLAFHHAA